MNVGVMIGIMVAIVIGIGLIPIVTQEGMPDLITILPYILVATILLGTAAWLILWGDKRESSNKVVASVKTHVGGHKKLFRTVLIVGSIMVLLQLSTCI